MYGFYMIRLIILFYILFGGVVLLGMFFWFDRIMGGGSVNFLLFCILVEVLKELNLVWSW